MDSLEDDLISRLLKEKPGFESLIFQLCTLVSTHPLPFIYINDTFNPRITSSVVDSILTGLQAGSSRTRYARVNAVACFNARLLYDSILNQLAGWEVKWDEGCENWTADGEKWNENVDAFCHGLKAVNAHLQRTATDMVNGKGKGKQKVSRESVGAGHVGMFVVIERAERLKETLPDLLVPLTRLAELAEVEITVIFISDVRWEDIRPALGASPDPYYTDVSSPTKEATVKQLTAAFMAASTTASTSESKSDAYHASLLPLFSHFASFLYSICSPFTQDTHELLYISAARWPGFVQPLLDEHQRKRNGGLLDADGSDEAGGILPPSEETRMRLTRLFTPSFTAAMETLYPRLTHAADWAKKNTPEYDMLAKPPGHVLNSRRDVADTTLVWHHEPEADYAGMLVLPRMSQFILVAAFLASTNPAKSDLRMFGRGLDEKKRKRRGGARKTGGGKGDSAKIPQRLLGPTPFPLDRLIAILGVLLEENDVDTRLDVGEFPVPGEYTEMEISRVQAYAAVMELTSMRLLHRTSASDKLDGPPMFKCGISYDVALALSRKLDVPLNDLMWEPA